MEDTFIYYSAVLLLFLVSFKLYFQSRTRFKNLPPSPPSLPILGNFHQLKLPLHRTLHRFSQQYGPIFSLRFGYRPALVVSSLSAVEECFTKNDIIFANRPHSLKGKYLFYDHTTLITSSYGDHWRNLRRISSLEILSTHRLNSFLHIRNDETKTLLRRLVRACCQDYEKVEIRQMFLDLTFNTIMRMVCGKRYYGDDGEVTNVEEAKQFRDVMNEMAALGLGSNIGDSVPLLRWIDYFGEKKLRRLGQKVDALFQGLIDEHRRKKESRNTMIDHLLSLQESQPEYYTDQIIKGLITVRAQEKGR